MSVPCMATAAHALAVSQDIGGRRRSSTCRATPCAGRVRAACFFSAHLVRAGCAPGCRKTREVFICVQGRWLRYMVLLCYIEIYSGFFQWNIRIYTDIYNYIYIYILTDHIPNCPCIQQSHGYRCNECIARKRASAFHTGRTGHEIDRCKKRCGVGDVEPAKLKWVRPSERKLHFSAAILCP